MKKIMIGLTAVVAAMLCACSGVFLLSSWAPKEVQSAISYKKVMVVSLLGKKDVEYRSKSEEYFAKSLSQAGVNASSAHAELGPKEFRDMTEQEAVTALKDKGVDAVLFITLLDKNKEKDWVPGSAYYTPYARYYYGNYWGHYNLMHGRVYTPGYFTTTTTYVLEADLYSVVDNKLQYSAQVKSIDPTSAESLASSFGSTVINDMQKKGVIPAPNK